MLNKVPEVTLFFWVIKIMCTTVGETAADYVNVNLGFGLTNTTYVSRARCSRSLLLVQFRLRRYVPVAYWSVVVVISVFGTLITDNMTDALQRAADDEHADLRGDPRGRVRGLVRGRAHALDPHDRDRPARGASTGRRSSSPSRSAPPPATWSPRRPASATRSSIAIFGGVHRADRARPLRLRRGRGPHVLAGLHPDPAARRADRRRASPSTAHKYGGLGLGTTGTSYDLRGRDPRARRVPHRHPARPTPDRGEGMNATTSHLFVLGSLTSQLTTWIGTTAPMRSSRSWRSTPSCRSAAS